MRQALTLLRRGVRIGIGDRQELASDEDAPMSVKQVLVLGDQRIEF